MAAAAPSRKRAPSHAREQSPFEAPVLDCATQSVRGIERALKRHWPTEYPPVADTPAVFDVVENVLQFELACALSNRLKGNAHVTWESRYSDYWAAKADIAIYPDQHRGEDRHRTVLELKWMSLGSHGLRGAATDALKLAWAEARFRYVLVVGQCDPAMLAQGMERAIGLDIWPSHPRDLKAARRNMTACALVGRPRHAGKAVVALFRIQHKVCLKT